MKGVADPLILAGSDDEVGVFLWARLVVKFNPGVGFVFFGVGCFNALKSVGVLEVARL